MVDRLIFQLQQLFDSLQFNVHFALMVLAALWLIQMLNYLVAYRLNFFGIVPRDLFGFVCIPFAPFLHNSFTHLFFNSIPLFVLSCFLLISGEKTFIHVSLMVIVFSGLGTWLFGRRGSHVGASSVVMGYFSYLLIQACYKPSVATWVLAGLVLYYFGSLFFSLFPQEERVSWEGHVFGFLAGIAAFYVLR